MSARKKKVQLSAYLDPEVMASLTDYAARRDQSLSLITEAALSSFLSPDTAERREAVLAKRLDQLDRRMTLLERDVGIVFVAHEVAIDAKPVHLAAAVDLIFAYDRNVVLALTRDRTGVAAGARVQIDDQAPLLAVVFDLAPQGQRARRG